MENKKNSELLESLEKFQEEFIGIEHTRDDDIDEEMQSSSILNEKEIRVAQIMVTVYMIEKWIQDSTLDLQPEYQRNLVWDIKRKSALIESMMLNIPIPAFYFDEDSNGKKNVIDGLQRLSTIHQYIKGEFRLTNLQYLSECEKKYYYELSNSYRVKILETMLVVNVLDERCSPMIKMDIFRRVNTGGIHLNPQEIRNIMATSRVREFLRNMSRSEEFILATKGKVNDIRMGAQELCLRYITLCNVYNWEKRDFEYYYGLLKMMDQSILFLNKMDIEQLDSMLMRFKKVMIQCSIVLGPLSFCKYGNNRINKSLFTSWAIVLEGLNLDSEIIEEKKDIILERYFSELRDNILFYNSITSSTGSRSYISYAIDVIRNIMEDVLWFKE